MVMTQYIKDPAFAKELFFYVDDPKLLSITYYFIRFLVVIPLFIMLSAYLLSLRSFYLKQQKILEEVGFNFFIKLTLWITFWLIQIISGIFVLLFAWVNFYKVYDNLFLM